MAAHESPRTTKLYDSTNDAVSLDGALTWPAPQNPSTGAQNPPSIERRQTREYHSYALMPRRPVIWDMSVKRERKFMAGISMPRVCAVILLFASITFQAGAVHAQLLEPTTI